MRLKDITNAQKNKMRCLSSCSITRCKTMNCLENTDILNYFSLNTKNHRGKTDYYLIIIVSTGDPRNPHSIRDYHWYRLDANGYWSHKPGRTHATNKDGRGWLIRDPRTANRGPIPYKFVCFMSVDRFSVKIRWEIDLPFKHGQYRICCQ